MVADATDQWQDVKIQFRHKDDFFFFLTITLLSRLVFFSLRFNIRRRLIPSVDDGLGLQIEIDTNNIDKRI